MTSATHEIESVDSTCDFPDSDWMCVSSLDEKCSRPIDRFGIEVIILSPRSEMTRKLRWFRTPVMSELSDLARDAYIPNVIWTNLVGIYFFLSHRICSHDCRRLWRDVFLFFCSLFRLYSTSIGLAARCWLNISLWSSISRTIQPPSVIQWLRFVLYNQNCNFVMQQ